MAVFCSGSWFDGWMFDAYRGDGSCFMELLRFHIILFVLLAGAGTVAHAQDSTRKSQDSAKKKLSVRELAKDVYHNFVVVESPAQDSTFLQKSETGFRPYAGKVIRNIYVRNLSFGENVLDTAHNFISALTRMADNLRTNTKNYVIRQLLFVRKGQLLDPYRLADNERFLRDQNFIKDARIFVRFVPESRDSVDVYVRVRDVFSWGGEVNASGLNDFRASIYDANLFGRAQRLEYTVQFDRNRNPAFGSQWLYRKTSIGGTFINGEVAYTTINQGASLGEENENTWYIKLDRPLYTPNARLAGGLTYSQNHSTNVFGKPDSLFRNYAYDVRDIWIGRNFGIYKQRTSYQEDNRKRRFVALRYYDEHFRRPPVLNYFDVRYADKRYLLAQLTWYQLNFYRTNYIYGFGRTEDIPVGMTRRITMGPARIDSIQRWYMGWEFNHWLVDKYNSYWNYTMAIGTNLYHGQLQDNSGFLNLSWYSPLFSWPRVKLRQFANISYAGIFNRHMYDSLRINNEYGLEHFNADSIGGTQRISLGTESSLYTRWQIFGFKIGFFGFGRAMMISPEHSTVWKGDIYPALGGGIRTRNENLIFGTIECRFTWFPRTRYNVNNISLTVYSNLRVRFTGTFVQAPWFALIK